MKRQQALAKLPWRHPKALAKKRSHVGLRREAKEFAVLIPADGLDAAAFGTQGDGVHRQAAFLQMSRIEPNAIVPWPQLNGKDQGRADEVGRKRLLGVQVDLHLAQVEPLAQPGNADCRRRLKILKPHRADCWHNVTIMMGCSASVAPRVAYAPISFFIVVRELFSHALGIESQNLASRVARYPRVEGPLGFQVEYDLLRLVIAQLVVGQGGGDLVA